MLARLTLAALTSIAAACATSPAPSTPPALTGPRTITLTGTVTRDDFPSYIERTFTVPPGAKRLTLTLDYEHKGDGVTLDLGLRDPDGQRGWSGSNKSEIVLSAWEATPSYRAGPIVPGEWTLILGIPNVREDRTASYTAAVEIDNELTIDDFPDIPFPDGVSGVYLTGDFHTHTGHSDGSCPSGPDTRMPCPSFASAAVAMAASNDFIAITDHNTLSQLSDIRALAPEPDLTIIPGTEITTFQGHANVFGLLEPLDFQLGTDRLPDIDALLDEVEARGALISINHPGLPSGERCMGCGWTAETDWSRVHAIEVINGSLSRTGAEEGPYSGIPFWEDLLRRGYRLTAIGGSDNHDPADQGNAQSPIGTPLTRLVADSRSVPDILEAVRAGRVQIDLGGIESRGFEIAFLQGDDRITVGGELRLANGQAIEGELSAGGLPNSTVEIISHNVSVDLTDTQLPSGLENPDEAVVIPITATGTGQPGWFRANIRDPETGKLLILGNPIYVVPE